MTGDGECRKLQVLAVVCCADNLSSPTLDAHKLDDYVHAVTHTFMQPTSLLLPRLAQSKSQ